MRKLIKRWDFLEQNRRRFVLGNGVRLDPEGYLELEKNDLGFLTTANLSAKTWLSAPSTSKRWIGFEAFYVNRNVNLVQVTDVKFRLSRNGAEQLFWSGAAWVAASPGQWNTEAEVASNIASLALSATHRGLQVIVNLSTSDRNESPRVMFVKALYESDVEWLEDLIARSLKPAIEEGVRPIAEAAAISSGTATVTLALEAAYDVVSIDSVYNLTTDPSRITNIFLSYAPSTKVVTMTAAQTGGDRILIRFKYRPKVEIWPSQDVVEVAEVPSIGIGNVRTTLSRKITDHESVINKVTGDGWRLSGGEQSDIEVPLSITTSKEKDAHRISDAITALFKTMPLLTLKGVDEQVRVIVWDEHSAENVTSMSGIHSASLRLRVLGFVAYQGESEAVKATLHFQLSGTVNVEIDS